MGGVLFDGPLGTMHIDGNFTQRANTGAALRLGLKHAGVSDLVTVSGDMTIEGGALYVYPQNTLQQGDSFDVLDWGGTLTGTFSIIDSAPLPTPLQWDYSQLYVSGVVRVITKFAADFDADGEVDDIDLLLWKAGFGIVGTAKHQEGDANRDGNVDGADFALWQQQFGSHATSTAAGGPASGQVPEPEAAALAVLAALACWRRGRN